MLLLGRLHPLVISLLLVNLHQWMDLLLHQSLPIVASTHRLLKTKTHCMISITNHQVTCFDLRANFGLFQINFQVLLKSP